MTRTRTIRAGILEIAYEETGVPNGTPVILLHGFPYDVRAYDDVSQKLATRGLRVLAPYLRGYGPTRFLARASLRSGQQAALAADLLAFMDALSLDRAILAGYDWGGRAACIVAALEPERAIGLVTCGGYNVQDIASSGNPNAPQTEHEHWYQFYFHGERGRRALVERRDELARYLWQTWSPQWSFDDATFARTAPSFDNPDFARVVVHSYRHRYALVAGDPAYESFEERLAERPPIAVPTIALYGLATGFRSSIDAIASQRAHFTGAYESRELAGIGHDVPQEAPMAFARAVTDLC